MWSTIFGLRTLEGVEAEFYLEAMQLVVDYLEQYAASGEEVDIFTYDCIFDGASFEQKVVLLHRCLTALLNPTVEAPTLTNTLEAAVYNPFAHGSLLLFPHLQTSPVLLCEVSQENDETLVNYRF